MTPPLRQVAPIPAAQYLRMSDEGQQYSIHNQEMAIQEYAAKNGFVIVKTYEDAGRSGVIAKNRAGLRGLLKDVVSGEASFKAILVYDVSRWGRFPNNDEAAHYEFLCSSSGIPLHYCGEPFVNDGTASSSILKALKRSMAAEFSRELGEKVFRGKCHLVSLGYWVGGREGCGYRRLMISADGKRKQLLKAGEQKSLTTDRVTLVLGPRKEVRLVQEIFALAIQRKGCTEIAEILNSKGMLRPNGREWEPCDVRNIVINPKYAGWNVWSRGSQKLRTNRVPLERSRWVMKAEAFPPIVTQATYDQAQAALPKRVDRFWSDQEILNKVRSLLRRKGRLSISLIHKTRGMPSLRLIRNRYGNIRGLYKAIGYDAPEVDLAGRPQEPSLRLRRNLVNSLRRLFPGNLAITHLPNRGRSIICVDDRFSVSIVLCPYQKPDGLPPYWMVRPNPAESDFVTLFCKINVQGTRLYSYRVFPFLGIAGKTHASYRNDPWLKTGIRLQYLSDFRDVATKAWEARSGQMSL